MGFRALALLGVAAALSACGNPNRYQQGYESDSGDSDTDSDSDSDTDADSDSDSDSDTDADTDADSDADTDSDSDADTDSDTDTDTDADVSCHPYSPVELSAWHKQFDVTYMGSSGDEAQQGYGLDILSNGDTAYRYSTDMTAGANGWSGSEFHNCDSSGEIAVVEWSVTYNMGSAGSFPITGQPNRTYLPDVSEMGTGWSQDYSYTLDIDAGGFPVSIPTEGTYVELGYDEIDTEAGTFDAYVVSNTFFQDRSALATFDSFMPGIGDSVEGYSELYYVEGIGLVYELTVDTTTGDTVMEKELVDYDGLTAK